MQCWIDLVDDWRWQVYMCWISGSLFVVPALIISACYAIIVRTIWAKGTVLGPIGMVTSSEAVRAGYVLIEQSAQHSILFFQIAPTMGWVI